MILSLSLFIFAEEQRKTLDDAHSKAVTSATASIMSKISPIENLLPVLSKNDLDVISFRLPIYWKGVNHIIRMFGVCIIKSIHEYPRFV
jgi:hypothetical protein